jgi:hypothetical protein
MVVIQTIMEASGTDSHHIVVFKTVKPGPVFRVELTGIRKGRWPATPLLSEIGFSDNRAIIFKRVFEEI